MRFCWLFLPLINIVIFPIPFFCFWAFIFYGFGTCHNWKGLSICTFCLHRVFHYSTKGNLWHISQRKKSKLSFSFSLACFAQFSFFFFFRWVFGFPLLHSEWPPNVRVRHVDILRKRLPPSNLHCLSKDDELEMDNT